MSKTKSKTQKKTDNRICQVLTIACEEILESITGFQWLTHQADYHHFPDSLLITCVFDTKENLSAVINNHQNIEIQTLIQKRLLGIGVKLNKPNKQISFDTEESCEQQHQGNWDLRLSKKQLTTKESRIYH